MWRQSYGPTKHCTPRTTPTQARKEACVHGSEVHASLSRLARPYLRPETASLWGRSGQLVCGSVPTAEWHKLGTWWKKLDFKSWNILIQSSDSVQIRVWSAAWRNFCVTRCHRHRHFLGLVLLGRFPPTRYPLRTRGCSRRSYTYGEYCTSLHKSARRVYTSM
jgi:hypothetical protein